MESSSKVALFGTCRVSCIRNHFHCTDLDETISFVHSTKEIIQLIKFITKQIEIPTALSQYCFRTGILNSRPLVYSDSFLEQFNEAEFFVIEVCATKKYIFEGYYLHHLAVDKRLHYYRKSPAYIIEGTEVRHQDPQEIRDDIAEILELVHPRKVLLVSHINATVETPCHRSVLRNIHAAAARLIHRVFPSISPSGATCESTISGTIIGKRAELIELLRTIAMDMGVAFFDPTVALSQYRQNRILQTEAPGLPPGHYTDFGNEVMGCLYADAIGQIRPRFDQGDSDLSLSPSKVT